MTHVIPLQTFNERMEAILYLIVTLTSCLVIYLAGSLFAIPIFGNRHISEVAYFFIKLALGYAMISACFALYHTGGRSVQCLVVAAYFAFCVLSYRSGKPFNPKIKFEWKPLLLCGVSAGLFVIIQLFRCGYFHPEIVYSSYNDFGVYSTVGEYLKITGVESSSPWYYFFDHDKRVQPYHFTDLWSFSWILEFLPSKPLNVYIFSFIPTLACIHFFGAWAILEVFGEKYGKNYLLLAGIAYLSVFFNLQVNSLSWTSAFHFNTILVPKTAVLPIFLALFFISRQYALFGMELFAILVLMVSNVLFAPAVVGAFGLFYLLHILNNSGKKGKLGLGWILISLGILSGFYLLLGRFDFSSVATQPPGDGTWGYWFIKIFTFEHLKYLAANLPTLLAFIFLWKWKYKDRIFIGTSIGLLFLMLSCNGFASAIMHTNFNYGQFTKLIMTGLSGLSTLLCLGGLLNSRPLNTPEKLAKSGITVLLLAQLFYGMIASIVLFQQRSSGVSSKFLKVIEQKLKGVQPIGAAIANPELTTTYTADPRLCHFCNFLKQVGHGYWVNQLALPEDINHLKFNERKEAVEAAPFFQFELKLKAEGKYVGRELAQKEFLKLNKTGYVVIEKGAVIPNFMFAIVDTIITDEFSKNRVIILKHRDIE